MALLGLGRALSRRMRSWAENGATIRRCREERYRRFLDLCRVRSDEPILDVGAGGGAALERFNRVNPIVAIDLHPRATDWLSARNVRVERADAASLPFGDREFPVAFSNSVIEHVPSDRWDDFAHEIRRVSERYFVQTPNRYFPIEPHYQFPLFQFLPERLQRALNARFTLGWRSKGNWEPVSLLTARDLRRLFPDAEIHRERVLGMTKSLMAVRRGEPASASDR